jgi:hypothetical protein
MVAQQDTIRAEDSFISSARRCVTLFLALLVVGASMLAPAPAHAEEGWEVIKKEQGIVVTRKFIPGYTLPVIRGVGIVDANIYDILAVLNDVGSNCKWMSDCHTSKLLKVNSDYDLMVYNRTATPWPLDDRDVVVNAKIITDLNAKTVKITFDSVQSNLKGPVKGVVRMPTLKGFYLLRYVSPTKTEMTYQAQADVGGMVPDWVANMKSKDLPFNTILAMRRHIPKTIGKFPGFLKKWDPAHGGMGFEAR